MKKLSIITICYNEPHLENTCQSIINQTWQDFEWIVIDGGSGSKTQAIWDKYKYRINKFISEKDNGIYHAMNKGIKLAVGQYLNFLNAGDSFHDNLVLQDIFRDKKQSADVLYGDYCFSTKEKYLTICRFPDKLSMPFWMKTALNHQATFIKRQLFKKYGLYDERLKILADYDIFLRFFTNKATFQHLNRTIVFFDENGISTRLEDLKQKEIILIKKRYFSKEEIQKDIPEWTGEFIKAFRLSK